MANLALHVFVSAKADGADATQVRPSNWNDGHRFVGGVNGNLLLRDTGDATYGAAWSTGLTYVSNALANAQGTLTADAQAFSSTATWNAVGIAFTHWKANITDTASAAGSLLLDLQVGGASKFKVAKTGDVTIGGVGPHAIGGGTDSSTQLRITGSFDTGGTDVSGLQLDNSIGPAATGRAHLLQVAGTIREAASGNHLLFTTVNIGASAVTAGVATVTNTASLYIVGAMSAVVTGANYAMWVADGNCRFDGELQMDIGGQVRNLVIPGTAAQGIRFGDSAVPVRVKSSLATPGTLSGGDWWVEAVGTSPSRVVALKAQDGGATRTIASMTY